MRKENQGDILSFFYCEVQDANGKIISQSQSYGLPTKACTVLTAKVVSRIYFLASGAKLADDVMSAVLPHLLEWKSF